MYVLILNKIAIYRYTCFMTCLQEDLEQLVKEMIKKFGTQNYIANLGHGIYPDMDPDHLAVFIDAVHRYSEDINQAS